MTRAFAVGAVICAGAYALANPLVGWKPELSVGKSGSYRLVVSQVEYEGSTSKVTSKLVTETPVTVTRTTRDSVQVTSGPLFARGRSVGRARVSNSPYNHRDAFAPMVPVVPIAGAKVGTSWKSPISAMAPVPAGIQGTWRLVSVAPDGKSAVLSLSASQAGASRLKVSGKLIVDGRTGLPKGGKVRFETEYLRPDMKDRSKMVVNSHQTIEYTIKPK